MTTTIFSSPSTPTTHRNAPSWSTAPAFSSPLASSPPSSPTSAAQERHTYSHRQHDATPTRPRHRTSIKLSSLSSGSRRKSDTHSRYASSTQTADDPQKAFLRERFRARCLDRAARDRERKIKGKRYMSSEPSSDMECEDDDEDETEAVLNDEVRAAAGCARLCSCGRVLSCSGESWLAARARESTPTVFPILTT